MDRLSLTDRLKSCLQNNPREMFSFICSMILVTAIIWYFHDRFWWPVDEGVYAYVAQRILAGDIIHRDLVDLHAGLGNYLNAAALALFGEDLLSLRYPLAVLAIVQSGIVFLLLRDKGYIAAGIGAVLIASTGFIQFPNPGAGWYALFLAFLTIYLATRLEPRSTSSLIIFGLLIGACFLIRQLSGVILSMGLLTWLLWAWTALKVDRNRSHAITGKILASIIMLGVALYLLSKMSLTALCFAGIWALIVCYTTVRRVDLCLSELLRPIGLMILGVITVALPMTLYTLAHGAFFAWLRDMLITPFTIHGQEFIGEISYGIMFLASIGFLGAEPGIDTTLSVAGWMITLLLMPVTGFLIVRHIEKQPSGVILHPLPIIAVFWAILSMHYQISHYFFSAIPVTFAALIWLAPHHRMMILLVFVTLWALWYQAAQPISRMLQGEIIGTRIHYEDRADLPRVSLRIETHDVTVFSELIETIESGSAPEEPLMTIPAEPELNFMTGRQVPGWYYSVPLGVRDNDDLIRTIEMMREQSPFYVVNRVDDKYHNEMSAAILEEVEALSSNPIRIGPFDLYRYHGLEYSRSLDEQDSAGGVSPHHRSWRYKPR